MIRVLTGSEMAAADAWAQKELGLAGLVLMENAGRETAAAAHARFGVSSRLAVVCGPGNNGGDGLAAARHLALAGHEVMIWLGADPGAYRGDALVNLGVAQKLGLPVRCIPADLGGFGQALAWADAVIDAYFGTGFRGEPRPGPAGVLRAVNEAGRPVLAVDIPSGVEADTGAVRGEAVRASLTVTFACPKLGCLLYPGAAHCGELLTAPISLPLPPAGGSRRFLAEAGDVRAVLPRRPRDAHKGDNGRVLIVGGSAGLTGAPVLAALGALRSGAGLVTAAVPAIPFAEKPAEVMLAVLPAGPDGCFGEGAARAIPALLARADVVAVGPGLGQGKHARALLDGLLEAWRGPLVLDADALNLLAAGGGPGGGHAGWVLTPHPGEMARLCGVSVAEIQADRVGWAERFAAAWGAVVVLKGVPTVTAAPSGETWLNPTGDPAMATGGMGDVLAGAVAGLIGQGLAPGQAAMAGAYLHGLAGQLAVADLGGPGILAREAADRLPAAAEKVRAGCVATPI
ncbi:MAG: NAD(P)H-hydrate dehydratase [Patescibacteria group bacterium]